MFILPNGSRETHPEKNWTALIIMAVIIAAFSSFPSIASAKYDNPSSFHLEKALIGNTAISSSQADLPKTVMQRIQKQIEADIYAVRGTPTRNSADKVVHWAKNPAMGYGVTFAPDQVSFKNTRPNAAAWNFSMQLAAYGYEGRLLKILPAKISSDLNRISYVRGELEEWYINTPGGIEQGFTLATPPGNQGSASLQFKIAVAGSLQPRLSTDGSQISLYTIDGQHVLTYSKLKVVDAKGKVLPAEMKTKGTGIVLAVNDAQATYPIIVDPVVETTELTANDPADGDEFGFTVAIDGDTLVVGARYNDDDGFNSGAAYVFERNLGGADNWGLETKILANDGAAGDEFGTSVAVDVDLLIVGAPGVNYGSAPVIGEGGAAYIFERNLGGSNNWGQRAKLLNDDPGEDDLFGLYVAISGDTAVVGVPHDDIPTIIPPDPTDIDHGSAYIFQQDEGGTDNWGQVIKLIPGDSGLDELFGSSVGISGDTVVVGTPDDDVPGGINFGAAHIFERDQDGIDAWGEVKKLIADLQGEYDFFGYFTAIDGDTIVVGAPNNDDAGNNAGKAYLFERDSGGLGNWGQTQTFTADVPAAQDWFGFSVSISGDTVAVGSRYRDDVADNAGGAYLFRRNEGGVDNWGQFAKMNDDNGAAGDEFGFAVAVSGDTAVIGARFGEDGTANSGSAFVYELVNYGVVIFPTGGLTTTEGGGTATFDVVLYSQPTADVDISLTSSDVAEGTLSDALLTFTTLNWNSPQTVTVTGVDDIIDDDDVAYYIDITASSTDGDYDSVDPANVFLTNQDDDTDPGITVTPTTGLTTDEAGGSDVFTIVLDTQPTADVTIDLTSSNVNEGTIAVTEPLTLTFDDTNWDSAQTVTVTGVDDAIADGDQLFQIVTAAASSTDMDYDGIDPDDVSVTNQDLDTPAVIVNYTGDLTTTEAGDTAVFTVVLNGPPLADVTIDLTSSDTTEGTITDTEPLTLTFTSVNWNSAQTVTITGVDDGIIDGDVAYSITTAPTVSTDPAFNGLDPDNVPVTNEDDDSVGIVVNPTSGLTTTEAGGTATFTVVLVAPPAADVTIGLSSDNIGEGTVSPDVLTFTSANWNSAQTVTVTGEDDAIDDGDVAYTIITAAAESTDTDYDGLDPDNVSVTNQNDDSAGVTVNPTSGLTTTEAGGTATFTMVLNIVPTGDVTIDLASDNTDEGTVSPASLTFTSANFDTAQTVTVTGVDDAIVDGNVGYAINTAAAVSADNAYNGLDPANVSVTNQDDDSAGITVTPTSGLTTTEAGGTATFTVVLNIAPTADVTISLSSDNTDEGTVSPASLTFTSANFDTAQTVTVTGVDDAIDDGDVAYSITTAAAVSSDGDYDGLDPENVSVSNQDDENAGGGGGGGGSGGGCFISAFGE